jgi:hypothetical protein
LQLSSLQRWRLFAAGATLGATSSRIWRPRERRAKKRIGATETAPARPSAYRHDSSIGLDSLF